MGIVTGRGKSQMRRSGNKIAFAIKIPKIAPDAPMVGISDGTWPTHRNHFDQDFDQASPDAAQKKEIQKPLFPPNQFQFASEHPEKQHVDQQMPDAAVKKNVSERLPQAEAREWAEGDEAKVVIDPRSCPDAKEKFDERLDQENARAD